MSTPARPGRAALWMIGAIVSFSSMAVAGREAGPSFDTFEIMTYRSAIGLVIVTAVIFATGRQHQIRTRHLGLHTARNIAHFTGQNLWFYAVTVVPLAQVFAIEFTSPLFVIALAALFLGERLTWMKIAAGLIGFLGVLVVLRPGTAPLSLGHLSVAAAAFGFAVTAIFTKRLTVLEQIAGIMFWLTALQLLFGIGVALIYDGQISWPTGADWIPLGIIAIAGLSAHYCLTTALTLAPASVVMPLDFVRLPAIAIVGMAFYDEPLSIAVLLGAAMIFGANYLNIIASQRSGAQSQKL
ncbi:MAG: DMT family transporter [Pseudomonadota bacterium]